MEDVWDIEKKLWLKGVYVFKQHLAEKCLMAFSDPVGIMANNEVLKSLEQAPRWEQVEFHSMKVIQPSSDTIVIAYQADAKRRESEYLAYCTSTYIKNDGAWELVQHQQTPIG